MKIRRSQEAFGTSFLDLLSSALVSLLIVYVVAPEEPSRPVTLCSAAFTIENAFRNRLRLVACVSTEGTLHCSTDGASPEFTWTDSSSELVAEWASSDEQGTEYWVAIADDFGVLSSASAVTVRVQGGAAPAEHVLSGLNRFAAAGELSE